MSILFIISMLYDIANQIVDTTTGKNLRNRLSNIRSKLNNSIIDDQTALSQVQSIANSISSMIPSAAPQVANIMRNASSRYQSKIGQLEESIANKTKKLNSADTISNELADNSNFKGSISGGLSNVSEKVSALESQVGK